MRRNIDPDLKAMFEQAARNTTPEDAIHHWPLVVELAIRFLDRTNAEIDLNDLIAEGMFAVIKALPKFNKSKRFAVTTYLGTAINNEFLQYTYASGDRGVHLPNKTRDQLPRIRKFQAEYGRLPTKDEMTTVLGRQRKVSQKRYEQLLNAFWSSNTYATEFGDQIEDRDDSDPSVNAARREMEERRNVVPPPVPQSLIDERPPQKYFTMANTLL